MLHNITTWLEVALKQSTSKDRLNSTLDIMTQVYMCFIHPMNEIYNFQSDQFTGCIDASDWNVATFLHQLFLDIKAAENVSNLIYLLYHWRNHECVNWFVELHNEIIENCVNKALKYSKLSTVIVVDKTRVSLNRFVNTWEI